MRKLFEQSVRTMFAHTIVFLGLYTFAQPLFALEFECEVGADKRFIRMEIPGVEHLCEVSVTYANKERKVMWYADNGSNFCSEKTEELRSKYETQWNFLCKQWPDHDGVDMLNPRQRSILDSELKALMSQGQNAPTPFLVQGLKVAASPTNQTDNDSELLVVQFFLHVPATGVASDVTYVIRDKGVSWHTLTKIETLAQHIDTDEGYVVDSALISGVTSNGALKVITALNAIDSSNVTAISAGNSDCYGNQVLAPTDNGNLVARTPHRYYCPNMVDAADGVDADAG